MFAIGRPRHRLYLPGVAAIGKNLAVFQGIPYLYRAITATQCDIFSFRRPCQRKRGSSSRENGTLCMRIPYTYSMIDAGGGDAFAIGRPRYRQHGIGMTMKTSHDIP